MPSLRKILPSSKTASLSSKFLIVLTCPDEGTQCKMTRSFATVDHDACGVGFVAQLGSPGSREVVERALEALRRLGHRGGLGADGRSGDGAGLVSANPDKLRLD